MKSQTQRRHVEIVLSGKVVRHSRNLRGLIAYGHRYRVKRVAILRTDYGAQFTVEFANGATCTSRFADFAVCCDFFAKRAPQWGGVIELA